MTVKVKILIVALILSLLFVGSAYASLITVDYTKFNSTIRTDYATAYDKDEWMIKITNKLTFNTTKSHHAKIFITNSSGTGYYGINLNLAPEQNSGKYSMDVYITSKVDPAATDWINLGVIHDLDIDKPYIVSLYQKTLKIQNDAQTIDYLKSSISTNFPAKYIGVLGSDTEVATAGNVEFDVTEYKLTIMDIVNQFIPLILTLALFGIALSFITKFAK